MLIGRPRNVLRLLRVLRHPVMTADDLIPEVRPFCFVAVPLVFGPFIFMYFFSCFYNSYTFRGRAVRLTTDHNE